MALKWFARYFKDSFLCLLSSSQTFGSNQFMWSKRGFSNDWNLSCIFSINLLARSFLHLRALLRKLSFRLLKFLNWIWIVSRFSKSRSMWSNFARLADKVSLHGYPHWIEICWNGCQTFYLVHQWIQLNLQALKGIIWSKASLQVVDFLLQILIPLVAFLKNIQVNTSVA